MVSIMIYGPGSRGNAEFCIINLAFHLRLAMPWVVEMCKKNHYNILTLLIFAMFLTCMPKPAFSSNSDNEKLYQGVIKKCDNELFRKNNTIPPGKTFEDVFPKIWVSGSVLCISTSDIDSVLADSVESIIDRYGARLNKVRISSLGGDAESAMRIGFRIYQNHMDVFPYGMCLSACANYIFLAGRHKYIGTSRFMGYPENKWVVTKPIIGFHGAPKPASEAERSNIDLMRVKDMHDKFFAMIGVSDSITDVLPCNLLNDHLFQETQSKVGSSNIYWVHPPQEMENVFRVKGLRYNKNFKYKLVPGTSKLADEDRMPVGDGFLAGPCRL
ncbi:hypothetical protein UCD39_11905 [Nitrospirillum sp. BR 11752]|uniref:hypothetical protein n=1 Tax=Nitrospirillum sp. BR 11752 TaxID=3104293 RepID=UPI002EAD7D77|nr:hypothetical protein [Nitrospirillum sp. BR 11752]